MIDFYTWKTPNGQKVAIMLEETGLRYKPHFIDLTKGEQFSLEFLRVNPNNKIPAITDREEAIHVFESGAILIYLAEKTGKFLATDLRHKTETIQWLMFQMGGVGPMLGQLHHFLHYAAERIPYAVERYTNEAKRIYRVMEDHLNEVTYFAGQEYSIADMAIWPWVNLHDRQHIDIIDYPNLKKWHASIAVRPAVKRALALI